MPSPTVSIITPTFGREPLLPRIHRCVLSQTHRDWEWLILDDSAAPSVYVAQQDDSRIRYRHLPARLSVGEKRNRLIESAAAEIIVQFDDDDYYAPDYVASMLARLEAGFDFVKLSGWFLYSVPYRRLGYWDLNIKEGAHHVWSNKPPEMTRFTPANNAILADNHLGFGFSFVFRKKVWEACSYPAVNWNEDGPFAVAAHRAFRFHHFRDERGLCLHVLHRTNTSRCFPQFSFPDFMVARLFPTEATAMLGE